jgi:hypothetical protein
MSLLRLLAAGKSLVGMKESGTRYHLTSQRLLPQFGTGKNPFSNPHRMETEPTEGHKPENGAGNAAPLRNQEDSTPRQEANIQQCDALPPRRQAAFLGRWKTKLVGLFAKRPRNTAPAAVSPRSIRHPVQSELALDRIRVVRNDLSDADVEVVSAKMARAASKPAAKEADRTNKAFERATARVVGVGKSPFDEDR